MKLNYRMLKKSQIKHKRKNTVENCSTTPGGISKQFIMLVIKVINVKKCNLLQTIARDRIIVIFRNRKRHSKF